MDNLTFEELVDRLNQELDPELLVEILELTVEDIAGAFPDRVLMNKERLLDE